MSFRSTVKKFIPKGLFPKIEPYGHLAEAILLHTINGFPARRLKVIGVTGTNGKTSTCFMIHRMLTDAGLNTGLMTTVSYGVNNNLRTQTNHMTNATVPELMRQLRWMRGEGIEWLVLETGSQALAQNRVWGIPYSIVVMTNVTHEHLDWHKTFENYRNAKRKLFKLANHNKHGLRLGIINADDPSAKLFAGDIKNKVLYGIKAGELRASSIELSWDRTSYKAEIGGDEYEISCNLLGEFNVYNSLAAVAAGRAAGLTRVQIEKGIAALEKVSGRMERVDAGQDFTVLVDFAVTPDALEKVLQAAHGMTKGRVIIVFGATGDRDKSKRPIMGETAGQNADLIYLTDDETYTEDPAKIRAAVREGIKSVQGKYIEVADREQAIRAAIKEAKKGDLVILAGIGHEDSRNMGGKLIPWSEKEVAAKAIRQGPKRTVK